MKKSFKQLLLIITIILITAFSTQAATYYSRANSAWKTASTWSTVGYGGVSAATAPKSGDIVYIGNGNTVTVSANATCAILVIDATGVLNPTGSYTVTATTSITINGTYTNQSTGAITTPSWTCNGTYNHASTSVTLPLGTTTSIWAAASNFNMTGAFTSAAVITNFIGQTFGNFTFNPSSMTNTVCLFGASGAVTIQGDFIVTNTGSSTLYMRQSGQQFVGVLNINGNFTLTTGIFDIHNGGATPTISAINLKGNLTLSGTSILEQTTTQTGSTVNFNFTGTGVQTVNISPTASITSQATTPSCAIQFGVATGATIDMGTSVLTGTNNTTFTLSAGAGIISANTGGISKSGATGSIQVNGLRTYNTIANYSYNSTTAGQVTGNALTAANNLTISNTNIGGVTFSNAIVISGNLAITTGAHVNLGTYTSNSTSLTLGGVNQSNGTSYGGNTSAAAIINTTYFNTATGVLGVSLLAPSNLSYNSPFAFTLNQVITAQNPTVTGNVTSWTIAPALPASLSFNTTTGAITGTSTVNSPSTSYTVTATNAAGTTTCHIVMSIGNYRYAVASTAWNLTSTWAATSDGTPGASVPGSGDIVFIGEALTARTVTIPSGYSAACGSLTMGNYSDITAATLTFNNSTSSLAVGNDLVINRPNAAATSVINVNAGSLSVGGSLKLAYSDLTPNSATSLINRVNITTGTITTKDLLFNGQSAAQSQIVFSGSGTLNISGNLTFGYILGTLTPSTGTVNFNGTDAQTIPVGISAITYNNLTINNTNTAGAILSGAISGTNVSGNLSVGNINAGSIFDNGGFAIALASGKLFNVANGSSFNLSGTSTMATVSGGGTKTFGATSTVNYKGAAQTVTAETYGLLTLSGSGIKTMPATAITAANNFSVLGTASVNALAAINTSGDFTLGNGTSFNASTFTHSVKGDWTNNGTFTPGTSTISFTGSAAAQTIGGSGVNTFNNLTINNTFSGEGVQAGSDITVNGVLNLASANPSTTAGALEMVTNYSTYPGSTNLNPGVNTLVSYYLNMGATATTIGVGDVTGIIKRATIVANTAYTFGHQYNTVSFTSGTMPDALTVTVKIGTVPSHASTTNAVKRIYEIVPIVANPETFASTTKVSANFHYLDSELNGNTESKLITGDYDIDGGNAEPDEHGRAAYDFTNNYCGLSNVPIDYFIKKTDHSWRTIFFLRNFQVNYKTWDGSESTSWGDEFNWTPSGIPQDGNFVIIPNVTASNNNSPILPTGTTTINTLTIEEGGVLVMGSNTLIIANSLSAGWEDQNQNGNNPGTSTVVFANAGATVSGTGRFYNLTINSGASLTNANNSTVKIENTITKTGSWFCDISDNTVEYNKAGTQTILIPDDNNYHSLTLSGSGTKNLPSLTKIHGNLTLTGTITTGTSTAQTIGGNFTIGSGTTFIAGAYTHNIGGNFINNGGAFTNTGNTINLNGTLNQTLGGSTSTTFNNLSINNSNGVTLGLGETVDGTLNMTSGLITTGSYILTAGCLSSITNASTTSYINGKLARIYCSTGLKAFPIGKGGNYRQLTLNYTALSGISTVTAEQFESTISGTNPVNTTPQANRYWAIAQSGTAGTYSLSLNGSPFEPGTGSAKILKGDGSTNTDLSASFSSPDFSTTGVTSFGNFAVATECTAPSIGIQPSPAATCDGTGTPTFSVSASGSGLSYLWEVSTSGTGGTFSLITNNGVYSNATTSTLTITEPPYSMNGYAYRVVVNRDCGSSITSDAVVLTVNALPSITLGSSPSVCIGSTTANLGYSASSGSPNQYRIDFDNVANTAGFSDVSFTSLPLTPIVLTVPGAAAGSYTGNLFLKNTTTGCESTGYENTGYSFTVTINPYRIWLGVTSDWNNDNNWCGGIPTASIDVIIPSGTPNDPIVNENPASPAECNALTINSGATLTIVAGKALSVSGTATLNGAQCLIIKSNATQTGSFIDNGIEGSGSANVERWVSDNGSERYEYISSPVTTALSSIFSSSAHGLWYVNEPTNAWVSIPHSAPQTMIIMKGYQRSYQDASIINPNGPNGDANVAYDFTGTLNTGDESITVTRTESAPGVKHGWNLVGNPYPSAIDWYASSGWIKTGVDNAIYFRRNGNVCSFVGGIGTGTPAASNIIPSMQSFWVRVTAGQTSGTLACDNNVRVHNATSIYKSTIDNILHIKIENNSSLLTDDAYVRFLQVATDDFDGQYDAYKMYAADTAYPQIFTNIAGVDDISINTMGELIGERSVPLGFKTTVGGSFTFNAELVSSFTDNGNTVYLEDLQTNMYQDLSANSTYLFTSVATSGLSRFILHFNPSITNINENNSGNVQIYAYNNDIRINTSEILDGDVRVYDMLGQVVVTRHLSGITSDIISMKPVSAVYIVKYISNSQTITKRIFINH